jgi:hypothetical protein
MKYRVSSQWGLSRRLATSSMALTIALWGLAGSAAAHAQTLTTLDSFNGTDGAFPVEQLAKTKARWVLHSNGDYYSTTPYGGTRCVDRDLQFLLDWRKRLH